MNGVERTAPPPASTLLLLGIVVGLTGTVGYQCGVARQTRPNPGQVDRAPASTDRAVPPVSHPPDVPTPSRVEPDVPARESASSPSRPPRVGGDRPVPSPVPPPPVSAILLSGARRLAVVEGRIVGIGGAVGGFTVTAIAEDHIVVRDAAGRDTTLTLRAPASTLALER